MDLHVYRASRRVGGDDHVGVESGRLLRREGDADLMAGARREGDGAAARDDGKTGRSGTIDKVVVRAAAGDTRAAELQRSGPVVGDREAERAFGAADRQIREANVVGDAPRRGDSDLGAARNAAPVHQETNGEGAGYRLPIVPAMHGHLIVARLGAGRQVQRGADGVV